MSLVRKGQTGTTYYLSGASYAPHGALASATVGSSAFTETREYNSRLQARRVLAAKGAATLLGLRWVYSGTYNASTFEETGSDNSGNVRYERIETPARNTLRSYGYDAANRLTSFAEDTGKSQNFGYDGFGNLWQTSASGVPELIPNGPTWYVQQAPGLEGQVTNRFNAVAYTAAGQQENLSVFGGPWMIRYDAEGRMERIERTDVTPAVVLGEYEYDAEGRRVKRVADGTATYYIYDASGSLLAEYGGTAAAGGTRYVVSDHLGSTRLVLDEAGGCRSRMDYAPFGAEIPRTDDCYVSSAEVGQKFTGQELDAESALYYFGARQYAWEQGRFVSPDAPLADQGVLDVQSWNLYSYVRNSPLSYVDPTGRSCIDYEGDVVDDKEGSGAVGDNGDGKGCKQVGVMSDEEARKKGAATPMEGNTPSVDVNEEIDPEWEARMAAVMYNARKERRPEWLNTLTSLFGYNQDVPLPSSFGGFVASSLDYANPFKPGPSAAGGLGGALGASYWHQRALNYAASTPSRTYGTQHLVYPNKSSVFRSLSKRSARSGLAGTLFGLDIALFQGLVDEIHASRGGLCQ